MPDAGGEAMLLVFTIVASLFVSMALIPWLIRAAGPLGLMDIPDVRKVHRAPIPRIGGLAIVAGTLIPIIAWVPLNRAVEGFLIAVAVLVVFGVWDDRANLNFKWKLLGQLLAIGIVVIHGGVVIQRMPIFDAWELPYSVCAPLTILALLAITNAVNLSDGLDGLAGGTTLLTIGCIGLLAYQANAYGLVLMALALTGAVLGFLRYNSHPARVFMGDTGSQFMGFSAGVLAILLVEHGNTALSPALPLLLFGLPMLDVLMVVTERLREGRSPFKADKKHIHHKLLASGLDHDEAVLLIYLLHAGLVSAAYFFRYDSDSIIISIFLVFSLLVAGLLSTIVSPVIRSAFTGVLRASKFAVAIGYLRRTRSVLKATTFGTVALVALFLVAAAVLPPIVPADISVGAVFLFPVLAILMVWRNPNAIVVERLCVYATAAFGAYLLQAFPGFLTESAIVTDAFFGVLAVMVGLGLRVSAGEPFRWTPLDFLIIFIVLLVPNLPGFDLPGDIAGRTAIHFLILLYACEMLIVRMDRTWHILRFATLASLLILGTRGVL